MGQFTLVRLPVVTDRRGDLTFLEGGKDIPFDIRRVYYLYNVPVNAERGGHAHKQLRQVIFALSGSFKVTLDDGEERSEIWLNNPQEGILVERLIWRELSHFSQGSVAMVVASEHYDEDDYYRDFEEFQGAARAQRESRDLGLQDA